MLPIDELESIAARLRHDDARAVLAGIREWYANPAAHIVVCGEFKRGKSSLVNALVEADVCPADALPATAVPALLRWAAAPGARVHFQAGHSEPIPPTSAGLSSLSVGGNVPSESVRYVDVGLPSPLLEQGLVIIDTPGVNDLSRQRADVTYRFLPMADAVLVVLDATAPVTRTEAAFLAEQVLPATRDRLIFALGKVDRLDEEDVADALDGAAARLEAVLGRPAHVIPVSAKRARAGDADATVGLRAALGEIVRGCTSDRAERLEARLRRVAQDLQQEAEDRSRALTLSPGERAEGRARVEALTRDLDDRFAALRSYVADYGEATLKELVATSLAKVHRELEEDLLHQVALLQGGIPAFVQEQVPYRVAVRLRQWGEAKGPEIEAFLARFIERVATDFTRTFQAPLETARMPRGIATPVVATETRPDASNRTEELLVERLIPVALPMAAGMLLFGPLGGVAGSMLGQLAASHLAGTKVETQRAEARMIIERELRVAMTAFRVGLDAEIARWFEQLSTLLRDALEAGRSRSRRLLDDPNLDERAVLNAERARLASLLQPLDHGVPS